MTTLVTIVHYKDAEPFTFLTPAEERIHNLLDGACDHFKVRRYLRHELVVRQPPNPIDGTPIDHEIQLGDLALRDLIHKHDLELIEITDAENGHG